MRAARAYLSTLLLGILWAAMPAHAAPIHQLHIYRITLTVAAPGIEPQGHNQHCDQLEDTGIITAAFSQQQLYGPVLLNQVQHFQARTFPLLLAPPDNRYKAYLYAHDQLILFPFHVFW